MPDPFKADLSGFVQQPLPSERTTKVRPLNESGEAMAAAGYSVLERADRHDPYSRNLRGIAPPVRNDTPNVAWDEEK